MEEIWKNYKGYKVSSKGRVLNLLTGYERKGTISRDGYIVFDYGGILGAAHRLVVTVFIGSIPDGLVVNHLDGNKRNNCVSNLEITTHSENTKHAYSTGLAKGKKGGSNSQAKLTETQCVQLIADLSLGGNNEEVGGKYGLHPRYVSLIRHGKRWKHLTEGLQLPKSCTYKYAKSTILLAKKLLDEDYTNIQVSRITGIEKSSISRLRSGTLWGDFIDNFYNNVATTIESTS